jgi:hypothetical protein
MQLIAQFLVKSHDNGVNIYPALVKALLSGNMVVVKPLLYGNASATNIATGASVMLNLTDPDSLTIDPRGNVVLDSQADSELVFISNPLGKNPQVGQLNLKDNSNPPDGYTADDTTFAHDPTATLLLTDIAGDAIYQISNGPFRFEPGTAYQASDTIGTLGVVNVDNGLVTLVVTGFGSACGLLFLDNMNNGEQEENGFSSENHSNR